MSDQTLLDLAQAAGVLTEWTDAYGKPQRLEADAMRTVLEALDLPCASEEQCRDSLARLAEENESASLPPLITAEAGKPLRLTGSGMHGKAYRIEFEQGGSMEGLLPTHAALPAEIAPVEQYGYHRLIVGDDATTLAVAPARCFGVADAARDARAKAWGLAVQLYALRRAGDGGIGDFSALQT
ncbi:MAG: malQ, partial [Noviherbaspirillum sp.]|nr:malQ [Noviherbaspirillum sp.]